MATRVRRVLCVSHVCDGRAPDESEKGEQHAARPTACGRVVDARKHTAKPATRRNASSMEEWGRSGTEAAPGPRLRRPRRTTRTRRGWTAENRHGWDSYWPASRYSRWRRRGSYKPARRGGQAPQRPRRPRRSRRPRRRSTSMTIRGQLEKRERKESSVRSL